MRQPRLCTIGQVVWDLVDDEVVLLAKCYYRVMLTLIDDDPRPIFW